MSDLQFRSALSHRRDEDLPMDLCVSLDEVSDRAMIDLRGSLDDPKFVAAATAALGVALPAQPRSSSVKGDITVLWMSVDQWLVTTPRGSEQALLSKLVKRLGNTFSFACDVSDARTIIRVSGGDARSVLMKGTSVDLQSPVVKPGWVRRLLFAEVAAACQFVHSDPDTFDVYVFRSYADYVWEWLLAVARKGARVQLYGKQEPPLV